MRAGVEDDDDVIAVQSPLPLEWALRLFTSKPLLGTYTLYPYVRGSSRQAILTRSCIAEKERKKSMQNKLPYIQDPSALQE